MAGQRNDDITGRMQWLLLSHGGYRDGEARTYCSSSRALHGVHLRRSPLPTGLTTHDPRLPCRVRNSRAASAVQATAVIRRSGERRAESVWLG